MNIASSTYAFRTRPMFQEMKPLLDKIEVLNTLFTSTGTSDISSELSLKDVYNVLNSMLQYVLQLLHQKELSHELKDILKTVLDDLYKILENLKSSDNLDIQSRNLISSMTQNLPELLLRDLRKDESLVIQRIKDSLICCETELELLHRNGHPDVIVNFKNFIAVVSESKKLLVTHAFNLISKKHQNLILLCINQIQKCILLLLKMYESERWLTSSTSYKESVQYLFARLKWCFSELLCVLEAPVPTEFDEVEDCGGLFIRRMDEALGMLAAVKVDEEFHDIITQLKTTIEEILCLSMAVAQVSLTEDSANITKSSQKVLNTLDKIKVESSAETINSTVRQTMCFTLADDLENLEQEVNNALLKLVLEVFSEPYAPLKKLAKASCSASLDRCADDLDDFIVTLDLHVDRLMQIGLFAMACSADKKRILRIRSCLASLESLEPELVPALTAFYLDDDKSAHRNYVKILSDHWQSEVLELEKLIDGIVDPAAFCQIVLDNIYQMAISLKLSLKREKTFSIEDVCNIYKRTAKLVRHLQISTCEMEPLTSKLNILQKIEDLNRACEECAAAADAVLLDHSQEISYERVLKRCKLIISLIKKLQPSLLELMNNTQTMSNLKENISMNIGKNAASYRNNSTGNGLYFPEDVKDLPLDIAMESCNEQKESTALEKIRDLKLDDNSQDKDLQPFLEIGKKLCQERSILYQTPKSVKKSCLKASCVHKSSETRTPRRLLFCRDDTIGESELIDNAFPSTNDTLGLDVTEILDKLTSLSNTLSPQEASYG